MIARNRTSWAAVLVALAVALVVVPAALAGKGGAGGGGGGGGGHHGGSGGGTTGGGTLSLVMVSDANANGAPNWNDSVTYTVATTATTQPYVSTQCYQGTTLVLSTNAGFYASYAWPGAQTVPLESNVWRSGGASCTAKLYSMDGGSQTILATFAYSVGA